MVNNDDNSIANNDDNDDNDDGGDNAKVCSAAQERVHLSNQSLEKPTCLQMGSR